MIKSAKWLYLPITAGERAYIINSSGEQAQTGSVQVIKSIQMHQGQLYITFVTKNSTYMDVPVYIDMTQSCMYEGEYIGLDNQVRSENNLIDISSIYQVDTEGVMVVDTKGEIQKAMFLPV